MPNTPPKFEKTQNPSVTKNFATNVNPIDITSPLNTTHNISSTSTSVLKKTRFIYTDSIQMGFLNNTDEMYNYFHRTWKVGPNAELPSSVNLKNNNNVKNKIIENLDNLKELTETKESLQNNVQDQEIKLEQESLDEAKESLLITQDQKHEPKDFAEEGCNDLFRENDGLNIKNEIQIEKNTKLEDTEDETALKLLVENINADLSHLDIQDEDEFIIKYITYFRNEYRDYKFIDDHINSLKDNPTIPKSLKEKLFKEVVKVKEDLIEIRNDFNEVCALIFYEIFEANNNKDKNFKFNLDCPLKFNHINQLSSRTLIQLIKENLPSKQENLPDEITQLVRFYANNSFLGYDDIINKLNLYSENKEELLKDLNTKISFANLDIITDHFPQLIFNLHPETIEQLLSIPIPEELKSEFLNSYKEYMFYSKCITEFVQHLSAEEVNLLNEVNYTGSIENEKFE